MKNKEKDILMEIAKRRGIIYPSFEIYGGLRGFYDYGPIGVRIKQNIEKIIREYYVIDENCFEVECPTLSPEIVWVASGHVENFADKLTECKKCGEPYRADHLLEEHLKESCDHLSLSEIHEKILELKIRCPKCKGELEKPYDYNLMFKTYVGPGKYKVSAYLRPETAQTTYLAFKRLWEVGRKKLPLGVLQIGHSFRNEISPRQGMIRLREFTQAEIQFFVDPENKKAPRFHEVSELKAEIITKDDERINLTIGEAHEENIIENQLIAYFLGKSLLLFEEIGIDRNRLKLRQHKDEERAFYSKDTWDIEFHSENFGRIELVGISDRTDYDLKQHMHFSNESMEVSYNGRRFVPHVIEVAYGVDRPLYCVLESCFTIENGRTYFRFPERVAPYIAAVFPLVNKDGLREKAIEIYQKLKDERLFVLYDDSGSIGRRYARVDEIGVPFAITIDYDTMKDGTVTIRYRDTREQDRITLDGLIKKLKQFK
ncbi:MAG: glycine--tRNA ligase [Candidatus Altiarchaeales archaeon]|nr:MAG: glycine--tRNA ligase [Candidatus Altiarchaeales archaeon]